MKTREKYCRGSEHTKAGLKMVAKLLKEMAGEVESIVQAMEEHAMGTVKTEHWALACRGLDALHAMLAQAKVRVTCTNESGGVRQLVASVNAEALGVSPPGRKRAAVKAPHFDVADGASENAAVSQLQR